METNHTLKKQVHDYWNVASCGTEFIKKEKFTRDYFDTIEEFRYTIEPEIFSFAQFSRYRGKKVLEVGVGAGTDFIQWLRSGALAHGIDLTQEAVTNVQQRCMQEGLTPQALSVGDAEQIDYPSASFDLAYSWGVIHHSPHTEKALSELIRVTKPGGTIKYMIYNRYSLFSVYMWIRCALLKGKPFKTLRTVLAQHQESPGTKAYTFKEATTMLQNFPVTLVHMEAPATAHDLLYYKGKTTRRLAHFFACLGGWTRVGWFLMIELKKNN